jgi:hypothetical protein
MEYSSASMESAVGMFKANLGQQDNASSGRAIRARQQEGDTANFHYIDNRDRAVEQLGRIVVDMIPRVYDTARQARILGDDGKQDFVQVDPNMPQAVRKDGRKVVAINLNVGAYDVRVKSGPSFANNRDQAAQQIVDLTQGNPQLAAAMAPLLMKLQDLPDSEKAYRVALAMLPPPVQEAYSDDEGEDIPPIAAAKIQGLTQELQMCQQALQEASQAAEGKQAENQLEAERIEIERFRAETERGVAMKQEPEAPQVDPGPEMYKSQLEADIKAKELDIKAQELQLEAMKIQADTENNERDNAAKILIAQLGAASAAAAPVPGEDGEATKPAEPAAGPDVGNTLAVAIDGMREAITQLQRPRKVVRGADGRVEGLT